MAHQISLVDPDLGTIHLSGTGTPWDGTGTPWTDQATSPFKLSMNSVTGGLYTPQAPAPFEIWRGGPPFRVGSDLSFRGYGLVDEPLGIQAYGASHDAAVGLIRRLRWALSRGASGAPAVLAVQPDGASQTVYYEVLSASIQETPDFIHAEHRTPAQLAAGAVAMVRATIQWRRTPLGGNRGSWQTLVNEATVGNTGTGSPDNLEALGTSGLGDLIYEGSPLNVKLALANPREIFIATCAGRSYVERNDAISTTVTSEGGGPVGLTGSYNLASFVTNRRVKLRFMVRIASASTNLQVRMAVGSFRSPWQTAVPAGGSASVLLDCGYMSWSKLYRTAATGTHTMEWQVYVRSTNGASATGTLDYVELIPYYTWGMLPASDVNTASIETFVQRASMPALPIPPRGSWWNGSAFYAAVGLRGQAPIYLSGAQLYVAWRAATGGNAHSTGETGTLTVTHAPLYQTLRGGGS